MKKVIFIWCVLTGTLLHGQGELKVNLDTSRILIGEQIEVLIRLKPGGGEYIWPQVGDSLGGLEIVRAEGPDTSRFWFRKEVTQRFTITGWDTGFYVVKPFIFLGTDDTLQSEAFMVQVLSFTPEKDTYYEIKEPFTVGNPFDENWFVILFGMVLLGYLFYLYIKGRKSKVWTGTKKIPPYSQATSALNELYRKKAWESYPSKKFYSRLTDILKEYLENELRFPAMEMVTHEFLEATLPFGWNAEQRTMLTELLREADMIKFAKAGASSERSFEHLKKVQEFIGQVHEEQERKKEALNTVK